MVTLLDLPYETIAQIADLLLLPDLQSLTVAYLRLRGPCEKALLAERGLKERFCHVDQLGLSEGHWVWPSFLSLWCEVFRLGVASYIEVLELDDIKVTGDWRSREACRTADELHLIEAVVQRCPFLEPNEVTELLLNQATTGDEDGLLAMLLPQLLNLNHLGMPSDFWIGNSDAQIFFWTKTVVSRVAKASLVEPVALPNLQSIDCSVATDLCSVDLDTFAPFLALRTVKKLDLCSCTQDDFSWPITLPKSHVQEIMLHNSTVSLAAIRGLATGIQGPCNIEQIRGGRPPGLGFPEDYESFESCKINENSEIVTISSSRTRSKDQHFASRRSSEAL